MATIENTLWVEKYRPSKLDDYIGNDHLKKSFSKYIKEQEIPNLLLHGAAGTGKTSAAKLLTKNIACDILFINASDENGIETIRTKVKGFASTMGFNNYKVIILDESDFLSSSAQATLRNIIEEYSATTRFILTCNFIERIIDPLQSRCQVFKVIPPAKDQVKERLEHILKIENIKYDDADLNLVIEKSFPDVRKAIQLLQQNIFDNELLLNKKTIGASNYEDKIIEFFKIKDVYIPEVFPEIKQILVDSGAKSFDSLYEKLYENIEVVRPKNISNAIFYLAEYQHWSETAVNKEIPTMALLIKLLEL